MGINSSSIADTTAQRNRYGREGRLRYGLDPEQLSNDEIHRFTHLEKRDAACRYLNLPLDSDDATLARAELAESQRIDEAYTRFKAEWIIKENELKFQKFLTNLQQNSSQQVATIMA